MTPRHEYGTAVRVTRNIRNDGTFPGADTGDLLIRCGTIGFVRDVGTFLQDQVIYTVHFLESDIVVGCREEELILAEAPWVDSLFERRDRVAAARALAIDGEVVVEPGSPGEVQDVLRFETDGVAYHVRFPGGRTLRVAEAALEPAIDLPEAATIDESIP